jgi:hypothetical protein
MEDRPRVGFAIKTPCKVQGASASLYLNFTHHPGITMPTDKRGRPVSEDQLHRGVGFLQIPIDVGTWRKVPASETDKLEYICDVVFHEVLIKKLMHDEYCRANQEFRPHLFELAMKTIETSLPSLQIERTVKLVKKCRYVHAVRSSGGYDTAEKFKELKGAAYADDPKPAPAPAPEPEPAPLIEEKPRGKKSSVVKKGFFNNPKAKSLYGEEGSGEGVLPENAGDPLGYIPKSLRNKCKIVDSNNPQYQQQEAAQSESMKQKAEFDKMFGDLGSSFELPSVLDEEVFLKGDDDGVARYSNDYSRFDKLDDVEDVKKPAVEERDFYYDEKGNIVKLGSTPPAPSTPAPVPQTPQAGYPKSQSGPVDSTEERARKAEEARNLLEKLGMGAMAANGDVGNMDPAKFMEGLDLTDTEKNFLTEMEPYMDEAMKGMNLTPGNKQSAPAVRPDAPEVKKGFLLEQMEKSKAAAQKQETTAGSDSRAAPQYTIACNPDVRVVVSMPLITSIKNVDLDVAARSLRIASPEYLLECDLPAKVDPTNTKASFKKASRELVLTIPLAQG